MICTIVPPYYILHRTSSTSRRESIEGWIPLLIVPADLSLELSLESESFKQSNESLSLSLGVRPPWDKRVVTKIFRNPDNQQQSQDSIFFKVLANINSKWTINYHRLLQLPPQPPASLERPPHSDQYPNDPPLHRNPRSHHKPQLLMSHPLNQPFLADPSSVVPPDQLRG